MDFDKAVKFILKCEGGFVNDVEDSGGETKFGISKKSYPDLDIENLTISQATVIYKRDFWDAGSISEFPEFIRLAIFDSSINCGQSASIRFLQAALGIPTDGKVGPVTLGRLDQADPVLVLSEYMWYRHAKNMMHPKFSRFGSGWLKRMMRVLAASSQ